MKRLPVATQSDARWDINVRDQAPTHAQPAFEDDKPSPASAVRCRAIFESDLDLVVRLLRKGFPDRSEEYWRMGFARQGCLSQTRQPQRYGYALISEDDVVGALITITSMRHFAGQSAPVCNLSSWYVDPRFRGFGTLLDQMAMRDKTLTYINVSPAPHTYTIHEHRGFRRYCEGQSVIIPALARRHPGQVVRSWQDFTARSAISPLVIEMMDHHVAFGCVGLVCSDASADQPVILKRRRLNLREGHSTRLGAPCLQLVYGLDIDDLKRWAGAIGRYILFQHSAGLLLVDTDTPISGVIGLYFKGRKPRYSRGPMTPAVNDLTYTELVIFGA